MSCTRCKLPKNFPGDERRCAFESGTFSKDNWRCGTMDALRDLLPNDGECTWSDFATRCDTSAASIGVLHIPESADWDDAGKPEDYSLQGYVVMTWYKQRGSVGSATIVYDDEEPRTLTLVEAEAIIAARRADHERHGLAIAEGDEDPVVVGIKNLMTQAHDPNDVANGLAWLHDRMPRLRKKIDARLATTIMQDQISNACT